MPTPVIDMTMLRFDMLGNTVGDAAERDDARACRVVAYIRGRFPAVRYNDAPEDVDVSVGRRVLDEAGRRKRP
jgi:hypothetical protein